MFNKKFSFQLMKHRRQALLLSLVLIVVSLGLLLVKGLNLGIDFTGGNVVQVEFSSPVPVGDVRNVLAGVGQKQAVIQAYSDRGVIIRVNADTEESRKEVIQSLKDKYQDMEVLRFEKVGPVVGEKLRREALIAVGLALLGILAYITVRFRFRFAVVSVAALIHDSIITLGVFSLTGREISLPFIAAILTIVGYSLNDTIVVLDRVRENWKYLRQEGIANLLDMSINQTLSRTINTSLTTFLPVLALFIWGGPVIANFSLALLVGIVVGTYSSIYVAGSLLTEWYLKDTNKK
ncbi:protein translocase subunit SecF [Aminobacterium sp. MB27-C1]|jgi:preprotein translocase subunit SecF|uniref:protein translocase subunit SecF n=1 Tax=unclassified Aminobacterium TaxID=2685012 RepID=UPI001BCF26B5|nr:MULTISPECIES: protein translocase subunit SecF [unclassified Aminobacterium]MEA4877201.1 protein translocase subunit SecF [Aminobacterium sp.]WMI70670.1 protein translocase subunit SecF [Aminobacterium sp. MB27-C1]